MELVASRFRDRADDTTGEAAVLRGDPSAQDNDLLNRVLENDRMRLPRLIFIRHHAIDQKKAVP